MTSFYQFEKMYSWNIVVSYGLHEDNEVEGNPKTTDK